MKDAGKPADATPEDNDAGNEDDREWAKALRDEGVPAPQPEAKPAGDEEPTPGEPEPGSEPTGEPAAEDEETPAAEDGEEPAEKVDDGKGQDPDRKKLSPELQKVFDKRIGELTGKAKRAEEQLEHERTRAVELDERVKDMEQELLDLRKGGAAQAAGVPKVFLATSDDELQAREDYLWGVERFCQKHPNGYEGNGTDNDPSFTGEEIQERLLAVQEERQRYLPKARELIRQRQGNAATLKAMYPELTDPSSEDHKQMEKILRTYPAMRMRPDAELMIGDMLAGKKAREAKAAGRKPAPRPAPAVPMGATPAGGKGGPMDKGKPRTEGRLERFAAGGHTDDALAAAFN